MKSNVIRNACAASLGLLTLLIWASAAEDVKKQAPSPEPGRQAAVEAKGPVSSETPDAMIKRWPPKPRAAAEMMLEKYGRPDQYDRDQMVWFNNGEWKRTIVHRRAEKAGRAKAFIEQTLGYLAPNDKLADLKRFNSALEVSPIAGEMTFASDSEAKNRLALNLADEIATGKRGVADARAAYLKTSRLAASGKSSPLLDALQFEADNTRVMTPTGADQ